MKDVELRRVRSALLWLVGGAAASATLGCVALFAFFEGGRSLPEMLACAGALGLAVAAADFAGRQFKTMLELAETCVAQKQHIESVAASFDAALANMPHGVALYDSEQRVLLANRRYAEMYGLQPGDIKPGMTMKEILELRAARGVYLGDDATRYVDGRVSAMATPRSEHDIERYANGRIIEKSRKPIPGGGWASVHEDVTDRRRAEEQVRQASTNLDATLDHMPQGLALYDRDQHIVVANQNYARLYGLSPDEIRPGMSMEEILRKRAERGVFVGDDPDAWVESRVGAMAEPRDEHGVERYADGRVIEKSRKPMPGGGWLSVHEDITARKRNEEKIVDVLATFDATLENMPHGVALFDKDQRIVLANGRYAQMYGLAPGDIRPGMTMKEMLEKRVEKGVWLGADPAQYVEGRVNAMTTPSNEHGVERYSDGRVIEKSRKPMPGGGWLSVHEDITVRQRAEDKIAELLATFDATLDNMPQGVALYDRERRIILANRRYAELYGLAREDVAPGTPMQEMLRKRAQKGVFLGSSASKKIDDLVSDMTKPSNEHEIERYADGRVIEKSRKPMPAGGWLSVHEDVTERVRSADQIAWMAHHDALTGLANRVVLQEKITEAFARQRRNHEEFALLLVDLDDFKLVNDTMGHPIGDKLLKVVADRLRSVVRDVDLVARIGGDEFAIVQSAQDGMRLAADRLAQRLMQAICAPYEIDGFPLRIALSIGVGIAPVDGEDAAMLMQNADLALYQAKAAGRRAVRFYNPDMDLALREERLLENELRHALDRKELEVHYQAIVDLASGRTTGMEALARWRHPKLGMVPPDRFIRVAERTGQINSIGAWILGAACAEAAKWPERVRVAVNLSPSQFKSGDLVTIVQKALRDSCLAASRLTLEITETTLLEKSEENLLVLEELRALGLKVALDDFGTGFSSLSYLKTIRFDTIKIDRGFVMEMSTNERAAHIIAGIVALSRALGFTTVAEGIETREQLDLVRAAGCTAVQGFLFSRPKPARELVFEDILLDARAA